MKNLVLMLLSVVVGIPISYAESSTQAPTSFLGKISGKQENFSQLNRQRRGLINEITVLEGDIRTLESQVTQLSREVEKAPEEIRFLSDRIASLDAEIKRRAESDTRIGVQQGAASSNRSTPLPSAFDIRTQPIQNLKEQKANFERRQQDLNEKSVKLLSLTSDIKKKREDLNNKRASLADLEEQIGFALNIDSERYVYRSIVSFIFAIIVFFLVYMFFTVVKNDVDVRKSIFSGDTGIQFITLFSIVIAVILFGILEILGQSELSALLGGLSGYILGKHQPTHSATAPPSAPARPVDGGV